MKAAKVPSEPEDLTAWFEALAVALAPIGLEAGPLAHRSMLLERDGFAVELLETRHVRDTFKSMPVKNDQKDARGIAAADAARLVPARALQIGVCARDAGAADRTQAASQGQLHDLQMSLSGHLAGLRPQDQPDHAGQVCEPDQGADRASPVLAGDRQSASCRTQGLLRELNGFEKQVRKQRRAMRTLAGDDGAGRSGHRRADLRCSDQRCQPFSSSKTVGAHFGMAPKRYPIRGYRSHRHPSPGSGRSMRATLYRGRHLILTMPVKGGSLEELRRRARQARRHAEGKGRAGQEAGGDPASRAHRQRPLRCSKGGSGMSGPANPSMAPCSWHINTASRRLWRRPAASVRPPLRAPPF